MKDWVVKCMPIVHRNIKQSFYYLSMFFFFFPLVWDLSMSKQLFPFIDIEIYSYKQGQDKFLIYNMVRWSRGMILVLGARCPGIKSRTTPIFL